MKILVGSDYHLNMKLEREAVNTILSQSIDLYVNCGDYCCLAGLNADQYGGYHFEAGYEIQQLERYLDKIENLNSNFIYCPGNHDPSLNILAKYHNVIVDIRPMIVNDLYVLVIPYTPFCHWNWELRQNHIDYVLDNFTKKDKIDILITHSPPLGILNEEDRWNRDEPTLRPVLDALEPRYYFCGHMHQDGGKQVVYKNTTVVNAACTNILLEL